MSESREYTVWNTPLSVLLRGRLGPAKPGQRRNPLAPVTESSLPEPAKNLITTIVKRTRLWKHEKQEIAEELLAHFVDGLESGRSMDDLLANFGDSVKAAKLMRRAKRRNRPLWWKIMHSAFRATECMALLYLLLFAWLFFSHSNPSVNYVASINRTARSAPRNECAWPIYRAAFAKAGLARIDCDILGGDFRRGLGLRTPGDAQWPQAKAFLNDHPDLIATIRQGATKPYLGLTIGQFYDFAPEDRAALGLTTAPELPPAHIQRLDENMMFAVLLPHLRVFRTAASIIAVDLVDAAASGESERVLLDYRTIRGLAHQVREHPIAIDYLVGLALEDVADAGLREAMHKWPASIAPIRVELLHAMASPSSPAANALAFERDSVLDLLQRIYTDSGNNEGHLTADGLVLLEQMVRDSNRASGAQIDSDIVAMLTPIAATVMVSRKQATEICDEYFALLEQHLRRPAWEQIREPSQATVYLKTRIHTDQTYVRVIYAPVTFFLPKLDRYGVLHIQSQAAHEALIVAVALEVYKDRTGHYPSALSDLVPQYLPGTPLDLSTGQLLCYKLKDGRPLLYGRGLDGEDDGGIWTPDPKTDVAGVPARGDWILYPIPEPPKQ